MRQNKFFAVIMLFTIAFFTMSALPSPLDRGQPATFTLIGGTLTTSGAFTRTGTYTMNPVIQTSPGVFHCTNNLVLSDGTITALTVCEGSTGTWRIVDGTGPYKNLKGNGNLVMYAAGETWFGIVKHFKEGKDDK